MTCRRSRSASGVSLSTTGGRVRGATRVRAFDLVESFLECEPFRDLPHDFSGADEVPFKLGSRQTLVPEARFRPFPKVRFLAITRLEPVGMVAGPVLAQVFVIVPSWSETARSARLEGSDILEQ